MDPGIRDPETEKGHAHCSEEGWGQGLNLKDRAAKEKIFAKQGQGLFAYPVKLA